MTKNIFEIAEVTPVLPDIWLVEGRAYRDVHVGDTVAIQVSRVAGSTELLYFKVIAATTYGELVPELDGGLTGGLTLEGKQPEYGKQIRKARFLVADLEE